MKRINYVGHDLVTGDRIANAILDYATALARRARADRVDIPVLVDERVTRVEVILGPASQLVVEAVPNDGEEPVDDELIAELERRTGRLRDPRVVAITGNLNNDIDAFEAPGDLLD